jgi:putative zinc finger protein
MNTSNRRQPSGPECARYESLLPQLQQGTLTPAENTSLRAHLATCAYCQAQLAIYDRLDAALHAYIDHYAPTAPSADDLVRIAVARVSSPSPEEVSMNHHDSLGMAQRENAMFDSGDTNFDDEITLPRTGYRPPHNSRTRPVLATIAALLLIGLAAGLFAMFARGTTGPANKGQPTATIQPTNTPLPTLQPTQVTPNGAITSGHPCGQGTSSDVYIGDLRVSRVNFLMGYPAYELPTTLATTQPYKLPAQLPQDANGEPNPPVNPSPNYGFVVCNTSSTASHVLVGVTVRVAAFSAYNGTLNTWQSCDGTYQRPNGMSGAGCGGGYSADEFLRASFATNATTGAQVTASQVSTGSTTDNGPTATALPISLGPGQALLFSVEVTLPTAPGTYSFAFGLNYDSVTSAPISTMQPTLFDSAAVKWTGQNCTKPELLSQIPTSDTTNKYICAP